MKLSLRPRAHALGCGLLLATLMGCAGPALSTSPPSPPGSRAPAVTPESRARFDEALAAFVRHDEARDWTPATCAEVASMFDAAAARGAFPEATSTPAWRSSAAAITRRHEPASRRSRRSIRRSTPRRRRSRCTGTETTETRRRDSIAALDRAAARFETFIARSAGKPEYAAAVVRARERLTDIDATKAFLGGSAPPPPPTPRRSP